MSIEIPKEVGPAETALRRKHIAELKEHAANQPAEVYRYQTKRAAQITRAMPVRAYIEQRRKLTLARTEASGQIDWSEGRPVSAASGYTQMIQALDAEHIYPPGLVEQVERRLVSGSPCAIPHLADAVEAASQDG